MTADDDGLLCRYRCYTSLPAKCYSQNDLGLQADCPSKLRFHQSTNRTQTVRSSGTKHVCCILLLCRFSPILQEQQSQDLEQAHSSVLSACLEYLRFAPDPAKGTCSAPRYTVAAITRPVLGTSSLVSVSPSNLRTFQPLGLRRSSFTGVSFSLYFGFCSVLFVHQTKLTVYSSS